MKVASRHSAQADRSAPFECMLRVLARVANLASGTLPSSLRARTSFTSMPSFRRVFNSLSVGLAIAVCLSGCGAEVAGTAATAAKLEAASAERAKAQAEKLQQDLEAAVNAREAAASAAEQ